MGLFDELIPQDGGGAPAAPSGGLFDDLVPAGTKKPPNMFDDLVPPETSLSQYPVEFAKGVAQGSKDFVGQGMVGASAAGRGFDKRSLDFMDQVDQGYRPTAKDVQKAGGLYNLDPYGYLDMTPEQRDQFRQSNQASMETPVSKRPLARAGMAVEKFGNETLAPAPGFESGESLTRDLGSGLGSMLTGIGVGMIPGVGPAAAGGLFVTSGMGQQYEDALSTKKDKAGNITKLPATEDQALRAASLGSIAGSTDLADLLIPQLGTPGKVYGLIKRVGIRAIKGAFIEGGQEGLQQFIQNVVAKGIYNPTQDLTEQVGYNALIGAILGGGTSSVLGGHDHGQPGVAPSDDAIAGAAAAPTDVSSRARISTPAAPQTTPEVAATPQAPTAQVAPVPTGEQIADQMAGHGIFLTPDEVQLGPPPPAVDAMGLPVMPPAAALPPLVPPTPPANPLLAPQTNVDSAAAARSVVAPPQQAMSPEPPLLSNDQIMDPGVRDFLTQQNPELTGPEPAVTPPPAAPAQTFPGRHAGTTIDLQPGEWSSLAQTLNLPVQAVQQIPNIAQQTAQRLGSPQAAAAALEGAAQRAQDPQTRTLYRAAAEVARQQPGSSLPGALGETIEGNPAVDVRRLSRILGPQMYDAQRLTDISVKEMFQNAFAAIKPLLQDKKLDQGKIDIRMDTKNRTVTMTDNGTGMTPQILATKFLEVAGTKKEGKRQVGGFGFAKLAFLYGNKAVRVVTMRDGKVAELNSTGDALMAALEGSGPKPQVSIRYPTQADATMFPQGHGTQVQVTIPEHYEASPGEFKSIDFDEGRYWYPVLNNSPLFANIAVHYNGVPIQNMGSTFDANAYQPFADVKFPWGKAHIYVSKEKVGYGQSHVLENGLWQFDTQVKEDPMKPFGPDLPLTFYFDLEPNVRPEDVGYPIAPNRQKFADSARAKFGTLLQYMSLVYQHMRVVEDVANFGDMEYLTYSPSGVVVSPKQEIKPQKPTTRTPFSMLQPGDQITVTEDGDMVVNGKKIPMLTPEEMEKFRIDPDEVKVDQASIRKDQTILHDNMDIKISEVETKSLVEYGREKYGKRFDEFVFHIGNAFRELRDVVATVMTPYEGDRQGAHTPGAQRWNYQTIKDMGVGVSFDTSYRGVWIPVPFQAVFINPVVPEFSDVRRAAVGVVGTMVHELAHHKEQNHDAQFPAEMQRILANLDVNSVGFNFHAFKQKVVRIYATYEDVFRGLNTAVTSGNFDIKPRGSRFTDVGSGQDRSGRAFSNLADTGSGQPGTTSLSTWSARGEATSEGVAGRGGTSLEIGERPTDLYSTRANRAAVNAVAPGATVVGQQPAVQPIRDRLFQALNPNTGGPGLTQPPPPAFPGATTTSPNQGAAWADRYNRFYQWMAGLDQLADANPRFWPLLKYLFGVRAMHNDEARIQDAALRLAKDWRWLGPRSENLTALIDDVTNMVYRTPAEKLNNVKRHPTPQELQRLIAKHKIDAETLQVYDRIRKMFDVFLDLVTQEAMNTARRNISDPVTLAKKLNSIIAAQQDARAAPYFPFYNFGTHWVRVVSNTGQTLHFESFDGMFGGAVRKQQRAIKRLQNQFGPTATVTHGMVPEIAEPFIGMPTSLLADIKNDPNIGLTPQQRQALDSLMEMRAAAGSFASRFQQKNYIPGYSHDFIRSFAKYFFHGSRYYARQKYKWQLDDAIATAKNVNGNKASGIHSYMVEHLQNSVLDYTGDFGALKSAIFLWSLGYVPAAAFQNTTQTPMITFPFLAGKFGEHRAIPAILKAMANIKNFYRKGTIENMTSFEAKAMGYGIKTGRITETQAPELAGMAQGSNLLYGIGGTALQRGWVHFMEKSGWMFEMAEQWNRRIAWRAAFDLALKHPNNKFVQASIVKFADEYQSLIQGSTGVNNLGPLTPQQAAAIVTAAHSVDQTQYVYARYARPRIGRGKIKSLIFVFQKYMQSTLFMLGHNKSDVLPRFLLMSVFLGGLGNLPFYDEWKTIMQAIWARLFKKHLSIDLEVRKYVTSHFDGKLDPDLVLHGLARKGYGLPAVLDMLWGNRAGRPLNEAKGFQHSNNIPFPVLDRSRALGMRILPIDIGKMMLPTDDPNREIAAEAQKASGAVFSVGFNAYKTLMDEKHDLSDPKRYERMMPRALSSATRMYRAFNEGRERGGSGQAGAPTIINYDIRDTEQMMEAIALGMGYQPLRLSQKWDLILAKAEMEKFYDFQRNALMQQMFEAIQAKNPKEQQDVRDSIVRFNRELPDWARGRAIQTDSILRSMQERTVAKAKREAGIPLHKQDTGISRYIDTLFPGVNVDVRKVR